ncbi:MAG: VTT domain-containing protein [Chloroflexota bacterium]|nr:VTT domain-containing protein [Chloroflexota bacterium]
MVDSTEAQVQSKSLFGRWWLTLLAVGLVVGLGVIFILARQELTNIENMGYLGAFIISLLAGATIIIPIPGSPAVFALGAILNPFILGPCAGLGEAIGEFTGYLAGRGGNAAIKSRFEKLYANAEDMVRRRGSLIIFAASCTLNPVFDMFGVAAGALRLPVHKFFFACWAGKTVKNTTLALLGWWGLGFVLRWFGVAV